MSCVGDINPMNNANVSSEGGRDEEHEKYPYEFQLYGPDGEDWRGIALGPDTVASSDGEYLIWHGTTYRRVENAD